MRTFICFPACQQSSCADFELWGSVYIRDLASREQVYINGVPEREAWLQNGDLVKIGSFTFKYKEGPTPGDGPEGDTPPHQADLEISGSESPLAIAEKVMLIGRRSTCDVSLMEASVSTAHAVIFHVGGVRYIRDLGSRTGTFVNGTKVHQHPLSLGDSIKIGETEMHYVLSSEHEHAISPVTEAGSRPSRRTKWTSWKISSAPRRWTWRRRSSATARFCRRIWKRTCGMFGAGGLAEATPAPAKDDDLIELEIAHEPQPTKKEFPRRSRAVTPPPPPPPANLRPWLKSRSNLSLRRTNRRPRPSRLLLTNRSLRRSTFRPIRT